VRLGRDAGVQGEGGHLGHGLPGALAGERRQTLQLEGLPAFVRTHGDPVPDGVALQIFQRILPLPLRIQGQVAALLVSH